MSVETQETYNGWANVQTWNVMLWIGNDIGLYDEHKEITTGLAAVADNGVPYKTNIVVRGVLDRLYPSGQTPDGESLEQVDLDEVRKAWNEDWAENNPQPRELTDSCGFYNELAQKASAESQKPENARPSIILDEHLQYLDNLRESGVVNPFGARPYLQEQFDLSKADSTCILSYWMKTFGGDR